MSQYVESACKTFTAGAAIAQYLRVTLTAGKLAAAGVAVKEIGVLEQASFADGDIRAVRLRTAQGTCKMVANAAMAVGANAFTAASGKIGPSVSTGFFLGTLLEAALADGDVVEVLRNSHGDTAV